ncbi:hypothetical protein FHT87_004608 [Rhizobium sp. BK316]|uniref:SGNH/GDSL hydrolase family protein n=1 Tax=Rhizobium sp. BK316 TaxID=2587053 RepID=UPI00160C86E9|nr:hypothetical protein [Rhizobium sp. BK316]MBB3410676.1 hypothetical protein [Rhizobium sp. BK316]
MLDPTIVTPRPGAGLATGSGMAPQLKRPQGQNLLLGTVPTAVSFSPGVYFAGRVEADGRKQSRLRIDGGEIAFFGDSNIDGLDLGEIPFASNFGIGGDTIEGLIYRLRSGSYSCLTNARAIVLAGIPLNNLTQDGPNIPAIEGLYASVMSYFTGPLVIVPPTRTTVTGYNSNISAFNAWLLSTYSSRDQCEIVDISDLQTSGGAAIPGYLLDYAHWGPTQQRIILDKIKVALRKV